MNKIYEELLGRFTDPDRTILNHYGNYGDKSYASDGHIAIETPQQVGGGEYEDTGRKIHQVFPPQTMSRSFTVAELKEKLKIFPPIDGDEPIQCEACEGDGIVEYEFYHNKKYYRIESECPVCDGEGIKDNISIEFQPIMKISTSNFRQSLVIDLLYIAEKLKAEIITLASEGKNKSSLFIIYDVRVLLMPTFITDKELASIEFNSKDLGVTA